MMNLNCKPIVRKARPIRSRQSYFQKWTLNARIAPSAQMTPQVLAVLPERGRLAERLREQIDVELARVAAVTVGDWDQSFPTYASY